MIEGGAGGVHDGQVDAFCDSVLLEDEYYDREVLKVVFSVYEIGIFYVYSFALSVMSRRGSDSWIVET